MNINLRLLATFLSVAEHTSFRKAAQYTNRSLPAVSMQIKQLEEQLGLALFQRTTRKVELTQAGEQLMISARKAMAELESGLTLLQHTVDVQQGHLSFACVPTIAFAGQNILSIIDVINQIVRALANRWFTAWGSKEPLEVK